ncbi:MAG TPA: 2-dehydropantoate 2-reductase [Candidatus Angelobacter sp.]|jgi:2-dehydropantoate 2-reductase|nr:2-dehydropantoate 2-reductase [Candidatus Angelobacter sp.]
MRYLIVGAGAVGAYIGAKMARAGYDITLHARGPHLRAMQQNGVRVIGTDDDFQAQPAIVGDLSEAGPVDVVFLCVKAHGLPQLAPLLAPILGPETSVVSTQNGIPWWYFQAQGGEYSDLRLERIDPGGVVSAAIEARRVIGSLIYFSTEIVEPGVIRHNEGNRISLGEPDGMRSERCRQIAAALVASGLRAPVTTHLRNEIWVKILGNVAFNPISALTRATLVQIVRHPEVVELVRNIMRETEALAFKLGMELPVSIEQRIAGAEKVGEHKTSMLQDLEAGRPMELEAIVGSVVELGERIGVAMPHTRSVYACTKLLAQSQAQPSVKSFSPTIETEMKQAI